MWVAAAAPLLGTTTLVIATIRSGWPTWAMNEDMVWNTAQSLFIVGEGGVGQGPHANSAPLTNALFAIAITFGGGALRSTLIAQAIVIGLAACAASAISGLVVARQTRALAPLSRFILIFAVGWLPYTGALLGTVICFGHANSITSYLLLWLAWAVYSDDTIAPLSRVALLACITTAVAASWAPLVSIPVALGTVVFLGMLKNRVRSGMRAWLGFTVAVGQLGVYALWVTLGGLQGTAALRQDGGTPSLGRRNALIVALVIVAVAFAVLLASRTRRDGRMLANAGGGALASLVLSAPMLAYLIAQRAGAASLWGYYPLKYTLLLLLFLAGVLAAPLANLLTGNRASRIASLVAAVILVMMPVLACFGWMPSFTAAATGIRAALHPASPSQVRALDAMGLISDLRPGQASLLLADPDNEAIANKFLIQLSSFSSEGPERVYSYVPGHLDDEQQCDLIGVWEREVAVFVPPDEVDATASRLARCPAGSSVTVIPIPQR